MASALTGVLGLVQRQDEQTEELLQFEKETKELVEEVAKTFFEVFQFDFVFTFADAAIPLPTYFSQHIVPFTMRWKEFESRFNKKQKNLPTYFNREDITKSQVIYLFLKKVTENNQLINDMDTFFKNTDWKYNFSVGLNDEKINTIFCKVYTKSWPENAGAIVKTLSLGYVQNPNRKRLGTSPLRKTVPTDKLKKKTKEKNEAGFSRLGLFFLSSVLAPGIKRPS